MSSDPDLRNIADRYKGWILDLIKEDLVKNSFPFAIMMENLFGDFNLSTVIRNANAFGAKEVFYLGKKKFDKRGAVGTYIYTKVTHLASIEELLPLKDQYTFVGVDNITNSVPIESFTWPSNPLLIFGEEGGGLSKEVVELCQSVVAITQYGSVRSLNAGTASGIAMYDFVRKYQKT